MRRVRGSLVTPPMTFQRSRISEIYCVAFRTEKPEAFAILDNPSEEAELWERCLHPAASLSTDIIRCAERDQESSDARS